MGPLQGIKVVDMTTVLAKSLNVGAIRVLQLEGAPTTPLVGAVALLEGRGRSDYLSVVRSVLERLGSVGGRPPPRCVGARAGDHTGALRPANGDRGAAHQSRPAESSAGATSVSAAEEAAT